jgi:hypothetical protein
MFAHVPRKNKGASSQIKSSSLRLPCIDDLPDEEVSPDSPHCLMIRKKDNGVVLILLTSMTLRLRKSNRAMSCLKALQACIEC